MITLIIPANYLCTNVRTGDLYQHQLDTPSYCSPVSFRDNQGIRVTRVWHDLAVALPGNLLTASSHQYILPPIPSRVFNKSDPILLSLTTFCSVRVQYQPSDRICLDWAIMLASTKVGAAVTLQISTKTVATAHIPSPTSFNTGTSGNVTLKVL